MSDDKYSCESCYFNDDGICEGFESLYFKKVASHRCPDYIKDENKPLSFSQLMKLIEEGNNKNA